MPAATLLPTEDQTFQALARWVGKVLDLPSNTLQIVKGFQNLTATPTGSYVVISPGIMQRQDRGRRRYDPTNSLVIAQAHLTYSYQLDCYGAAGPTWASVIAAAWDDMWGVDNMVPQILTPLYADAPWQANIVNAQGQQEQRFVVRLFAQVNQDVGLPQDFFDQIQLDSITVADQLP